MARHEAIVGEVDDAHAADAQLADDLVIGVVGQFGRWGAGRRTGCGTGASCTDGLDLFRRGGCSQGRFKVGADGALLPRELSVVLFGSWHPRRRGGATPSPRA